jgi:DegV family protein with EDD domain
MIMKIVTDRGMDLSADQIRDLDLHFVPLRFTLDGKTYTSGVDIQPDEFYELLGRSEDFPITSQPSAGDFAAIYRQLAESGEEILSLHISSGLSGTLNSARLGAAMVPEARVTFFDSLTLSCPLGWQVQAAAQAARAGWSMERILAKLKEIRASAEGIFTLTTLKYLIHGGRISHLKGLLGSLLNIKPVIGVEKEHGTYVTYSQDFTLSKAIARIVEKVGAWNPAGTKLRVQPLHAKNPDAIAILIDKIRERFEVMLEPLTAIAPVLGAHTGPSLIGLAVAPAAVFADLP